MIRDIEKSQAVMAMEHLGIDPHKGRPSGQLENMILQLEVLTSAMDIYEERGRVRGETWAEFDHHDCIHHLTSKLARLKNAAQILATLPREAAQEGVEGDLQERIDELGSAMEDDALDVINYAAFLVRHLTGRKLPIACPDTGVNV